LEREKAEILRLEREQQRLEREKIEAEREELKRRQARYNSTCPSSHKIDRLIRGRKPLMRHALRKPLPTFVRRTLKRIMNHSVQHREFNDCFDVSWSNSTIHSAILKEIVSLAKG
jgi:hypothetical protein